jgi:hypothetical protein
MEEGQDDAVTSSPSSDEGALRALGAQNLRSLGPLQCPRAHVLGPKPSGPGAAQAAAWPLLGAGLGTARASAASMSCQQLWFVRPGLLS